MEPTYRAFNHQVSSHVPQSSTNSYSTEQARRAGYMGPEPGRIEHEHFRVDFHLQHPQPHPYLFYPTHSLNLHEAIQIEIQKEQIRQKIIVSEIMRRRIEAAVRRELMMINRELDLRRSSYGFPFGSSSPVMEFDLPCLGTRVEERSVEEIIVLNGSLENEEIVTRPFRRGTADLRISEVKPVPVKEGAKEKEKTVLLGKPNKNISGSKRKAVTPEAGGNVNGFPPDGVLKKKAKVEWSCGLCQVHVNNERVLNEHLQGKKHKAKEAASANTARKNYRIKLSLKKTTESIQDAGAVGPGKEASSKSDHLHDNLPDSLKKNEQAEVQKVQKNGDLNKKKHAFWCEVCQVGVFSDKVLNAHRNGKKHIKRLQQINRNGGSAPSDQKSTKPEDRKLVSETNPDDNMNKPEEMSPKS